MLLSWRGLGNGEDKLGLSMVLIAITDGIGFNPTFRKSYSKPFEETLITYLVSAVKFVISLAALEQVTWVTTIYPASLVIMNGAFVVMLYIRRKALLKVES